METRPPSSYVHHDHALADSEAGFSGDYKLHSNSICRSTQISSPMGGFRARTRSGAPRFEEERQPHFLSACFMCKKRLGNNRDIFMYRGDTAFCSEDCRQEQIDMDESMEKKMSMTSIKALRKKQQEPVNRDYKAFRAGAVAAV